MIKDNDINKTNRNILKMASEWCYVQPPILYVKRDFIKEHIHT